MPEAAAASPIPAAQMTPTRAVWTSPGDGPIACAVRHATDGFAWITFTHRTGGAEHHEVVPVRELAGLKVDDEARPDAWPLDLAPRDGTILRLLVDYSKAANAADIEQASTDGYLWSPNALEDSDSTAWTIGFNNFTNTCEDAWEFAGWCWSQDHFTDGNGQVVGWLPFHGETDAVVERLRSALRSLKCGSCGGSGVYTNHSRRDGRTDVACKVCDGTGEHAVARAALGQAKAEPGR